MSHLVIGVGKNMSFVKRFQPINEQYLSIVLLGKITSTQLFMQLPKMVAKRTFIIQACYHSQILVNSLQYFAIEVVLPIHTFFFPLAFFVLKYPFIITVLWYITELHLKSHDVMTQKLVFLLCAHPILRPSPNMYTAETVTNVQSRILPLISASLEP